MKPFMAVWGYVVQHQVMLSALAICGLVGALMFIDAGRTVDALEEDVSEGDEDEY